jgi:hypothetical protein
MTRSKYSEVFKKTRFINIKKVVSNHRMTLIFILIGRVLLKTLHCTLGISYNMHNKKWILFIK